MKTLYRSKGNKYLFGICGGLGEYFNIDPNIIRLFIVVLALVNFISSLFGVIIVYIVAYFIIPEHPGESGRERERGEGVEQEEMKAKALKTKSKKKS